MPLYEYRCDNDHLFEVVQPMSADPLETCEVCGAPARRVLHAPAVHFKGKGFYNTDYGTKKRQREKEASESSSKSDSKSSSDSSSSSSDAKPAEKPSTDKKETAATSGS